MNRLEGIYKSPFRVCAVGLAGFFLSTAIVHAQSGPEWDIYGQLNFGVMAVDDGANRDAYFAENPNVPSRFGVFLTLVDSGTATLQFNFETGFGFTGLDDVSPQNDGFEIDMDRSVLRKFEVIYDSADFGRLSFGQGSMASDGASGADLTGTGLAIGPAIGDLGGNTEFLLPNGMQSGIFASDAYDDLDGPRRFRIRYDTPERNGLRLSVAYGQEVLRAGNNLNYRDVSLSYARQTDAFEIEAATSYEWVDNNEERFLASASIHHVPTGLTAALATGHNQIGSGEYAYVKLGVIRDLFDAGPTSVALEYYRGSDFASFGMRSRAVGIGAVQHVAALNLDVVFAHRLLALSAPAADYQDITVTMLGARWRF